MHGTDHQIEMPQHLIRQIQAAIGQDIDLYPLEQCNALEFIIEAINFVDLL